MGNSIHYLTNQFVNATEESRKLMTILSADHLAKLTAASGDALILSLKDRFKLVHDDFIQKYQDWITGKALYKSATRFVYDMLEDLTKTKIRQWEAQVSVVYLEGSAKYLEFFPNGRTPFIKGNLDQRINEVGSFADRLVGYIAFDTLRIDVNTFHLNLVTTRSSQQQKEEIVDESSQIVEQARVAAGVMMYMNLGLLMDKFGENPEYINNYWEFELIMTTTKPTDDDDEEGEAIVLVSNQNTSLDTVNIRFKGTPLKEVIINWDDETTTPVILDASEQIFSHNYTANKIYNITITGNTDEVTGITAQNCKLIDVLYPAQLTKVEEILMPINQLTSFPDISTFNNIRLFNLLNNNLSEPVVNLILTTIDSFGTSNGQVNLGGTNAAPTGDALVAKQNLISRGWIVTTN